MKCNILLLLLFSVLCFGGVASGQPTPPEHLPPGIFDADSIWNTGIQDVTGTWYPQRIWHYFEGDILSASDVYSAESIIGGATLTGDQVDTLTDSDGDVDIADDEHIHSVDGIEGWEYHRLDGPVSWSEADDGLFIELTYALEQHLATTVNGVHWPEEAIAEVELAGVTFALLLTRTPRMTTYAQYDAVVSTAYLSTATQEYVPPDLILNENGIPIANEDDVYIERD